MSPSSLVFHTVESVRLSLNSKRMKTSSPEIKMSMLMKDFSLGLVRVISDTTRRVPYNRLTFYPNR